LKLDLVGKLIALTFALPIKKKGFFQRKKVAEKEDKFW
jgi:hypothetical protein